LNPIKKKKKKTHLNQSLTLVTTLYLNKLFIETERDVWQRERL
jgi:hypothetical protein